MFKTIKAEMWPLSLQVWLKTKVKTFQVTDGDMQGCRLQPEINRSWFCCWLVGGSEPELLESRFDLLAVSSRTGPLSGQGCPFVMLVDAVLQISVAFQTWFKENLFKNITKLSPAAESALKAQNQPENLPELSRISPNLLAVKEAGGAGGSWAQRWNPLISWLTEANEQKWNGSTDWD